MSAGGRDAVVQNPQGWAVARRCEEDFVEKLRTDGYAVVPLRSAPAARSVRSALACIDVALEEHHSAPLPKVTSDCISVAAFAERAQLRYQPTQRTSSAAEPPLLERAAAEAAEALEQVAHWALSALGSAEGTLEGGTPLLDAFWYPGFEGWGERPGMPPPPCPAHEDVGIVSVIADTLPGLEARGADGCWRQLELREDECVVIVGRALAALSCGRLRACTHRVRLTARRRTSLVFERRPDAVWAERLREMQLEAAKGAAAASSRPADELAKMRHQQRALDALGGCREPGPRCAIM
jgi:hypothetical protein